MPFDPDAFLASGAAKPAFDPDAFVKQPEQPEDRGALDAAVRGVGNAVPFNAQMSAGLGWLASKVPGASALGVDSTKSYTQRLQEIRGANRTATEQHPYATMAGGLVGTGAAALATGGASTAAGGAAAAGTLTAKQAAIAAANEGAVYGTLQGLGESEALDKGDVRGALSDAAKSGIVGGLTGGVLGGVGAKLLKNAEKNAAGWVVKDISGEVRGASTPTARKQLADDAVEAAKLVRGDKKLGNAIEAARHGDSDAINEARAVVHERLQATGAKLDPQWAAVDKALPGGGVRAGDLVDHLQTRIDELRATGHTTDAAEADALAGTLGRISKARDWGYGPTFDPAKPVATGTFQGLPAGQAVARLEKMRNPRNTTQIDTAINDLRKQATTVQFDPDHMVSARQVQRLWSDEAGVAYSSMGGINGTQAFTRKLDVAGHLRDFRDQLLQQAAGKAGTATTELAALNRRYAGLKRIQTVLDQRANRASIEAGGASVPAIVKQIKHPWHAAVDVGIGSKRAVDRFAANLMERAKAGGPTAEAAQRILALIAKGVPRATAIQMARSAAPGGMIDADYRALVGE